MNTFNLNLDLDKRGGVAQWVTLRQGDHNGTELRATIYDHGTQAGGGYTCRVSIRLPGAGDEYYRETATYTNGVAVVTVDEEYAAAIVGVTEGYFELLQGDAVIASTESFGVRILRSAQDGAVPGDKYDSAIEDALAELDEATGRISQMVVDATEEYLEAHPELTTTVEDNSLTDIKLIQHGGILDRVARLWHRLDNLLTATPAESDALTVTDAAKTPLAGLALYGRSTQDGTPTPSSPVAIQNVTPNYLNPMGIIATSGKGITITPDSDGWFNVSGTVTGTSPGAIRIADFEAFVSDSVAIAIVDDGAFTYNKVGVQVTRTVNGTSSYDYFYGSVSQVYSTSGLSLLRFTLYLMASATGTVVNGRFGIAVYDSAAYSSYVPYQNVGLWAHGRNLFAGISASDSRSGLDKAYDSSTNTLTISGTSTVNNNDLTVSLTHPILVPEGARLVLSLSGTVSVGSKSNFVVFVRNPNGSYSEYHGMDSNNTVTFTGQGGKVIQEIMFRSNTSTGAININAHVQLEFGITVTAYQPYAESTTPIPLQGHELRSLPDGTRDEVTVDQYGNAVLIQRVGVATVDGTYSNMSFQAADMMGGGCSRITLRAVLFPNMVGTTLNDNNCLCTHATYGSTNASATPPEGRFTRPANSNGYLTLPASLTTAPEAQAWLTDNPVTFYAPLDEPVTIDLGTVDPVALQGPDMTAQAVPTAPFALTYERDLNVTLARLEASIAELATN